MRQLLYSAVVLISSYISGSFAATANATCNSAVFKYTACRKVIWVSWWSIPPYVFYKKPDYNVPEGIFPDIISDLITSCCHSCVEIKYLKPSNNSEELKGQLGNGSQISFPIYGSMIDVKYQNKPYFPLVESPGVIYLTTNADAANAAQAVLDAVLQGWPVLVLTLIMAALSGIVMWALDSYWNPDEFPPSFFKGAWEGFWWAFVSMTTVGYGDRAPKSFVARLFAFFWVLVGLVIISIFTATVTTSLTALSLSNDITLYGSTIVALNNTEEQRYGIKNNAKVKVRATVPKLRDAILNKEDDITGGLIDSYVAGEFQEDLKESSGIRVGTVFDHQFAYGFVIAGSLEDANFEKCMRRTLSTKETEVTQTIQQKMKALPEPAKSAAEEKSSNLFDPKSPIFKNAVFTCLGLIAALTIAGIAWEYFYWRPRQPKPEKSVVERILTPHTSFEELVAAQAQELEDAMITEVMAFYKAWNRKLEEIKQKNLRDDSIGTDGEDRRVDILNFSNPAPPVKA